MFALTLWVKLCVFNFFLKSNLCELILERPLDLPVPVAIGAGEPDPVDTGLGMPVPDTAAGMVGPDPVAVGAGEPVPVDTPKVPWCTNLQHPPNGSVTSSLDGNLHTAYAIYSCNDNIKMVGFPDRSCRSGRWRGDEPTCEPIIIPLAKPVAIGGFMMPFSASCIRNQNNIVLNGSVSLEECAQACILEPRCRSFEYARAGTDVLFD
eukprot:372879_1